MKGQLSAEMLIVLVVILGVAILLGSSMLKGAAAADEKIEKQTERLLDFCVSDDDCGAGEFCDEDAKTCK